MHELSITRNIVAICEEQAQGRRVQRVLLEIGKLTAILPDALRFCFDLVAEETHLEDAKLEIVEIEGRGRCCSCQHELLLTTIAGRCERCDSTDVVCVAGEELNIKEIEVV